jgi:hypothetical protein
VPESEGTIVPGRSTADRVPAAFLKDRFWIIKLAFSTSSADTSRTKKMAALLLIVYPENTSDIVDLLLYTNGAGLGVTALSVSFQLRKQRKLRKTNYFRNVH